MMPEWMLPAAVVMFVLFIVYRRRGMGLASAKKLLKDGAVILDVRTPKEFAEGHVPNAINIPLDQVEQEVPRQYPDRATVLLIHCQSGMRSQKAVAALAQAGYTNAHNIGGLAKARGLVA